MIIKIIKDIYLLTNRVLFLRVESLLHVACPVVETNPRFYFPDKKKLVKIKLFR